MWCSTATQSTASMVPEQYGKLKPSATHTSAAMLPPRSAWCAAARIATAARPALRSLPRTAMSLRTLKYLPLPQPTSATVAPDGSVWMNLRTSGQIANLQWGPL